MYRYLDPSKKRQGAYTEVENARHPGLSSFRPFLFVDRPDYRVPGAQRSTDGSANYNSTHMSAI